MKDSCERNIVLKAHFVLPQFSFSTTLKLQLLLYNKIIFTLWNI